MVSPERPNETNIGERFVASSPLRAADSSSRHYGPQCPLTSKRVSCLFDWELNLKSAPAVPQNGRGRERLPDAKWFG